MGSNSTFLLCFIVNFGGGVDRFVPTIVVVEGKDTTHAFGLFQILASYSQILLHYIVHELGENDSYICGS
jgi:hypothetical protein